jgi:hypothetical protein
MTKIVYLVQCPEHANTNVYKIGRSDKGVQRISSYGKDVRILCALNHNNPVNCERNLIAYYFNNYILFKGNEYFKINIDEAEIINKFIDIVTNNLKFTKNKLPIKDDIDENDVDDAIGNNEHFNDLPLNIINKSQKNANGKYYCKKCDYLTPNFHHIDRHIKTNKHVNNVGNSSINYIKKVIICSCSYCGENFMNRKAKWRHEKQCNTATAIIPKTISETDPSITNNQNDIILMQQSQLKQYESMLSDYKNVIDNLVSLKKS